MLRDPIDKWLSNALYWSRGDALDRQSHRNALDLQSLVFSDRTKRMAAFVRDVDPAEWTARDVASIETALKTYSNEFSTTIGSVKNLERDFVVGDVEDTVGALVALAHVRNWSVPSVVFNSRRDGHGDELADSSRRDVSTSSLRAALSPAAYEAIKRINSADVAFYKAAKKFICKQNARPGFATQRAELEHELGACKQALVKAQGRHCV